MEATPEIIMQSKMLEAIFLTHAIANLLRNAGACRNYLV
jgi:hypothetical protein